MSKIVKNSLGYDSNLFVFQDKDMFNYSVDTILLGNFATIKKNMTRVLEVGTNNAALAIFLADRYVKLKIDAIEIQEKALELACKNVELNNKSNQVNLICADFNEYWQSYNKSIGPRYDLIICNPPFYRFKPKNIKDNYSRDIANYEITLSLEQLISGAAKIIKQKGYLSIVEPTERLVDIFEIMRKYGFEPKRVQLVYPRVNQKSNLVLVEAMFKTSYGTDFLPNLYLHPENKDSHEYLPDVIELYKPKKLITKE